MREDELRRSRILIVEDQEANIRFLKRLLKRSGYEHVRAVQDPRLAKSTFQEFQPDLVLLDLHMPHMDGFQVMEAIKPDIPTGSFLPILVLTGDREPEVKIKCLSAGAKDFVAKPFRTEEVQLRIKNLLETRHLHQFLEGRNENLELEVQAQSFQVQAAQLEVLHRLAVAAEYRDDITGQHAGRVGALAGLLAETAGLPPDEVSLIRESAPLHDVGKIGIPDSILLKPGRLTFDEFEVMKNHTTIGGMILSKGSFPLLELAREIALSHHEWWDGSGYPAGLSGSEIPVVGRIVSIVDVFDSITHERPYKKAFSTEKTLGIMADEAGRHFDPDLFNLFIELVESGQTENLKSPPNQINDRFGNSINALGPEALQSGEHSPGGIYSPSPTVMRLMWDSSGDS